MNVGEKLLYGVCVLHEELFDTLPSFCRSSQLPPSDPNDSSYSTSLRCYCLVSRYPFFDAHFNVLYTVLAHERLFKLQTMMLGEEQEAGKTPQTAIHKDTHTPPPVLKKDDKSNSSLSRGLSASSSSILLSGRVPVNDPLPVPSISSNNVYSIEYSAGGAALLLIIEYYNLNLPRESHTVTCSLGPDPKCTITFPRGTELQHISEWALPCLFRVLSLEDLLTYVSAILLEKSCVIASENPGVLSAAVLAIIPLIFPLVWQGPLITILPFCLEECLHSPVPIVAGMAKLPQDKGAWKDHIIVDLDQKTVRKPSNLSLPLLPEKKQLLNELRSHYSVIYDNHNSPAFGNGARNVLRKCTFDEINALDNIIICFRKYITWLVDADAFTPANRDSEELNDIMKQVPKSHQPFFRQMISTQQYSTHAVQIKTVLVDDDSVVTSLMTKLDKMVADTLQQREDTQSKIRYLQLKLDQLDSRLSTLNASKVRLRDSVLNSRSPGTRRLRSSSHKRNKSWMQ